LKRSIYFRLPLSTTSVFSSLPCIRPAETWYIQVAYRSLPAVRLELVYYQYYPRSPVLAYSRCPLGRTLTSPLVFWVQIQSFNFTNFSGGVISLCLQTYKPLFTNSNCCYSPYSTKPQLCLLTYDRQAFTEKYMYNACSASTWGHYALTTVVSKGSKSNLKLFNLIFKYLSLTAQKSEIGLLLNSNH